MAAALVVKALGKGYVSYIVGGVVGEAIMVAGYFAYEGLILGMGMAPPQASPATSCRLSRASSSRSCWSRCSRAARLWTKSPSSGKLNPGKKNCCGGVCAPPQHCNIERMCVSWQEQCMMWRTRPF